ncbi:MAG TPA: GNAT family N-acetyltransferase [Methyloceanibacter sp.]|nr:GNAT family N-acetyltransferase [Methyloceanibacter sp.]
MTIRNIEHCLRPRSVAVIGASSDLGSVGNTLTQNILTGGFQGPVTLVNPHHSSIGEHRCFKSIEALPEAPELAVIATPPDTVPGIIEALGKKGTRGAVVITAGFSPALKQAILDAAQPYCLRIIGPNCLGISVPELGLNANFGLNAPNAGSLAFLSQSGALMTGILDWAAARDIGFSYVVSMGDMTDVDVGDLLDFLAADVSTSAILLYLETIPAARKFMSAARSAARAKPVIVIKSGRDAAAAQAAATHTGALAGSDAAVSAAFRRAGPPKEVEKDGPNPRLAIRPYPNQWERWTETLDGERILVRPIKPADEHLYGAFVSKLSPDDIRFRFLAPRKEFSHKFIARFTQIDYARAMAFVALNKDETELYGVARLSADPDYLSGEYAIIVRSDLKGTGIGWILMRHLIHYAEREGLKELSGDVLEHNTRMLDMCRQLGFEITADPEDVSIRKVRLKLPAPIQDAA